MSNHSDKESPVWQIVEYMQRNGPTTIKDLETLLGITTTAVRQHLNALLAEGYVQRQTIHAGVGRPYHAYGLTDKVRELFACRCDDLALTLLEEVFALEGNDRTQLLLERVGNKMANRYASTVKSTVVHERVEQLADALQQRGVLTDVLSQDKDVILLKMYNCPFHELAQAHRAICDMDAKMIQKVVGADVKVDACIMDGQNSCSFVVAKT